MALFTQEPIWEKGAYNCLQQVLSCCGQKIETKCIEFAYEKFK